MANISVFHTEDKEWNSSNSSRSKNYPICSNYHLFKSYTIMRCRFNCHIYYTIYIIFTEFFKLNVWYYNVTHLYKFDYRLLSHISSYLYEIFMELFLSRQNNQIAPVLDICGWHCVVTPSSNERSVTFNIQLSNRTTGTDAKHRTRIVVVCLMCNFAGTSLHQRS